MSLLYVYQMKRMFGLTRSNSRGRRASGRQVSNISDPHGSALGDTTTRSEAKTSVSTNSNMISSRGSEDPVSDASEHKEQPQGVTFEYSISPRRSSRTPVHKSPYVGGEDDAVRSLLSLNGSKRARSSTSARKKTTATSSAKKRAATTTTSAKLHSSEGNASRLSSCLDNTMPKHNVCYFSSYSR